MHCSHDEEAWEALGVRCPQDDEPERSARTDDWLWDFGRADAAHALIVTCPICLGHVFEQDAGILCPHCSGYPDEAGGWR